MATIIRALADALHTIRHRENELSRFASTGMQHRHHVGAASCDTQARALTVAIMREPPHDTSDLRPMLMAAAEELEGAIDADGLPDAVADTLEGVLIALEHAILHPALGLVSPGDEAWNVPLYRQRAAARLIDPSQVQPAEEAA